MKVLVTGGAGFIGSKLVLELIEREYSVVILDNLSTQIHGEDPSNSYTFNLVRSKCELIVGDVMDTKVWEKALNGVDILVHLAAETGTGQSMYQISKYIDVNIGGTAKMLEMVSNTKNQVKKIIIAASRAVYGEGK